MSSLPDFTNEQKAILKATGLSVAVSAGAGCGKTFVLTQRFLAYLRSATERPDPLSGIIAITFTDRAAREMRHRVRVACQQELLRCTAKDAPHWLGTLRALDTARISTIHAFCANLLRRFAVEAGLDPAFGLLDASFGDAFIRRAVRDGLCRLLEQNDGDATRLVVRFELERCCELLEHLLEGARLAGPSPLDDHTPESLCALWRSCWNEQIVPALIGEFWASPAALRVIELLQQHEPGHPVMGERRALLLELLAQTPATDPATALTAVCDNAKVQGGGTKSAWTDAGVYEEIKGAFETLRKQAGNLLKELQQAEGDAADAAELALTAHRVVHAIADQYAHQKRDAGRLDFDDLLSLARNLLRDNVGVRKRAAAGIELLMVDEFQDTDPVQAEIVRLLCGEKLPDGMLFLVGDAKQSIYRFRRADPRVFETLRGELPAQGQLPLTTNFRSQPAILRFVNYVFESEIPNYEPLVAADSVQHSPEPSIEFLFAPAAGEDGTKDSAEGCRRREARWIAGRIAELLADEVPRVYDSTSKALRRVEPGDVAILFRALSNVHLYEQALQDRGLEYYLAGGRAFFAQQEIHDLTHLCRWLDDPADELSLAGALRSPLFGLNDDTLFLLKPQPSASLAAGLARPPVQLPETQAGQVRRANRILSELRAKKDLLPLGELLSLAIERTAYDAALYLEHLGPRKLANLRKLIRLARSFDESGALSLGEFVDELRDAVREEAREELAVTHPEVSGVLRLMTIHQAKGLEFPVVILADMDWKPPAGLRGACYHPELGPLFSMPDEGDGKPPHLGRMIHKQFEAADEEAERTRLLYVATTRARDHLILSASLDQNRTPQSSWLQLLARRFKLNSGEPVGDAYLGSAGGTARKPDEVPYVLAHHVEPLTAERAGRQRADHGPLRQFRELVSTSLPRPLPPLVGSIAPDVAGRGEFTVSDLCDVDRTQESRGRRKAKAASRPQEETTDDRSDYARLVGTVTHAVLERIDFSDPLALVPDALAREVDRALLFENGEISETLHRRITGKLAAFVASPLCQTLATAKRLCREVEFRLCWDRAGIGTPAEILGTIDCLYETEQGVWHVIDYKAVDEAGQSEDDLIANYELQLAAYAIAVEQLFGRPPQTANLVRLGPPTRAFSVPVTNESLADAACRIDAAITRLRRP